MTDPNFGPIVARTFLHSSYVADVGGDCDAVIVSEIIENDKGETRPNLKVIKSPQVRFWVTQVPFRTHSDKKEFESLKFLDEHRVPYKEKDREIFRALNDYSPNYITPKMRRELQQSPYLYGGNIAIEALVAMKYKKDLLKSGKTPHTPTTGFLDIEQSLLPGSEGMIPLIVFTAENQVFLAMKKSFMTEKNGTGRVDVTIDDVRRAAHEHIDPMVDAIFAGTDELDGHKSKLPFTYNFYVGETEVDMIRWIFKQAHATKVSFIGIWNLGYDIGEIIKVLNDNNIPLEDIFAEPNTSILPKNMRYASYREDKRQVAHFTQKWHWLTASAHFQFVDSQNLYSYIRVVDGKESSYALDDILHKFGLGGKLKIKGIKDLENLQTADWHREMLRNYFTYYAIYAMWDGMGLQILEWRNNDLTAMMLLGDTTPAKFFPNQTIRVTNTLFEDWMPDGSLGKTHGGHVLGTGVDVEGMKDDDLSSAGGAVLKPQKLVARGMKLFKEWPNHATHCYFMQNDFDFSGQYPSNTIVVNISKQTKVATMISINAPWVKKEKMVEDRTGNDGKPYKCDISVEVFCSYLITPTANGVELGVDFFDLPDYGEMDNLFQERLKEIA